MGIISSAARAGENMRKRDNFLSVIEAAFERPQNIAIF
jgi:hypothetical protein